MLIFDQNGEFLKQGSLDRSVDWNLVWRAWTGKGSADSPDQTFKMLFWYLVEIFFAEIILKPTKKLPIDEMQIFAVFILGLSLEDLTRTNLC